MQTRDYIEIILTLLGGVGFLAIGLGYGYGKWREGNNKNKLDTITLLSKDVETLKSEVVELTKTVEELRKEIAEKDKKLGDALAILQGRDPQMQSFMDVVKTYVDNNKPFLEEIKIEVMPVIKKLDKFLDKQVI